MATPPVQSVFHANASASSGTCTWPSATTAGNLLVAGVMVQGGSGETITTPSGWTLIATVNNSTNLQIAMYYIENAGSRSGTETFAISPNATILVALAEYSGAISGSSLDGHASNTGSSGASNSGSVTTTQSADIVVACTGFASLSSSFIPQSTPSGGFTQEQEGQKGSFCDFALNDLTAGAAGTYSTGTTAASNPWAGMIAAFKTTSAGPPVLTGEDAVVSIGSVGVAPRSAIEALTGQSLLASLGTMLGPADVARPLVGQAATADVGKEIAAPYIGLLGQLTTASASYATHAGDEVVIISGQECAAETGALAPGLSGALTGLGAVVTENVAAGPNDVFAALVGVQATVGIECHKIVTSDSGPGQKTYTIFDKGGSHDIPKAIYPSTLKTELRFPIPAAIIPAGTHVTLDDFGYYANGDPVGSGEIFGPGPYVFDWDAFNTIDFDGLGVGEFNGLIKEFEHGGGFYPKANFDWQGNYVSTYNGPFHVRSGLYADFSGLIYGAQGTDLVFEAGLDGHGDGPPTNSFPYVAPSIYCAYIQFTVTTISPDDYVRLSADTFDGALNVAWVSEGFPGKLKTAVHLAPQLQIGSSDTGWRSTQTIESDKYVYSCGIVYLPDGRLLLHYNKSGKPQRRYNETRATTDVSDWSRMLDADSGYFSAAGRGQQQDWRFLAGAKSSAGAISFSQCRDNTGETWTQAASAVPSAGCGPLVGGAWLGNEYGILYTRFSDEEVLWLTTPNPGDWTVNSPIDTTFTGSVCGLARHPSGRLVGLTQASAGGAVNALISNDVGKTWTQTSALGITPAIPPVIVCIGAVLYAVYVVLGSPDVVHFMASVDGGVTWT